MTINDHSEHHQLNQGGDMGSYWCPMGDRLFRVLAAIWPNHPGYQQEWAP